MLTFLLSPYLPHIPSSGYLALFFVLIENGAFDSSADELFGFDGEPIKVIEVDPFAYQHQVEVVGIAAKGKVAKEVGRGYIAEAGDKLFHQAVDPHVLAQDAGDVAEQQMVAVGTEHLPVLLHPRDQQTALLEAVQFQPDGIGALTELFRKASQMAINLRSQEKFGENLQPGFTGNQEIEQGRRFIVWDGLFVTGKT